MGWIEQARWDSSIRHSGGWVLGGRDWLAFLLSAFCFLLSAAAGLGWIAAAASRRLVITCVINQSIAGWPNRGVHGGPSLLQMARGVTLSRPLQAGVNSSAQLHYSTTPLHSTPLHPLSPLLSPSAHTHTHNPLTYPAKSPPPEIHLKIQLNKIHSQHSP